jgi:hypothetical protein
MAACHFVSLASITHLTAATSASASAFFTLSRKSRYLESLPTDLASAPLAAG